MLIPWRVKNLISSRFPLFYHVMANMGIQGNSSEHWDSRLDEAWDAPIADWPTKESIGRVADVAVGIDSRPWVRDGKYSPVPEKARFFSPARPRNIRLRH